MAKTGLGSESYGKPGVVKENPGGTRATASQQPSTGYREKMADACDTPNKLKDLPRQHDRGPGYSK